MTIALESTRKMPSRPVAAGFSADGLDRLERARSGDAATWEGIVREIGPTLVGYARARGVDDPEDLMQDVFLAAASRLESFTGDWKAFRSWVFSIAYRQVINRYRAPDRPGALPAMLLDRARSPEDQVMGGVIASEALRALEVLTPVERDVVLLRVVAGLETDEVASAVGKRRGNVRVIQTRALAKLREELVRRGYGSHPDDGMTA